MKSANKPNFKPNLSFCCCILFLKKNSNYSSFLGHFFSKIGRQKKVTKLENLVGNKWLNLVQVTNYFQDFYPSWHTTSEKRRYNVHTTSFQHHVSAGSFIDKVMETRNVIQWNLSKQWTVGNWTAPRVFFTKLNALYKKACIPNESNIVFDLRRLHCRRLKVKP